MSDLPKDTKDRLSGALRERLRAVVDELSLDINDPFMKLLAHAIASREAYDDLRGDLQTCIRQRDAGGEYAENSRKALEYARQWISDTAQEEGQRAVSGDGTDLLRLISAALAKNPSPVGLSGAASAPDNASHSIPDGAKAPASEEAGSASGPVGLGPDAIDLEADARHEAKMESYETALPSRPQDWRTVPHVPTRAMVDALVDCVMDSGDYERAFVLAINAAPKLPSQFKNTGGA